MIPDIYPILKVDLEKMNQIFEKCTPPENEEERILKRYEFEHQNNLNIKFLLYLGVIEQSLGLSIEKIQSSKIDYLIALGLFECCDEATIVDIQKKQIRISWSWNTPSAPCLLTLAGTTQDFFVEFEKKLQQVSSKMSIQLGDFKTIANQVIESSENQEITFYFTAKGDWKSTLTISLIAQEVAFTIESKEEKFPLLKLSSCLQVRLIDPKRKLVEIISGNQEPDLHCFIYLAEPYVSIKAGYSPDTKPPLKDT